MNEQIYYNIDRLHNAISENKKIVFKYCETVFVQNGQGHFVRQAKHGGADYNVSPWVLSWDNENYYLIAFDENSSEMRHYRVDKMESIRMLDEERTPSAELAAVDPAEYSKRVFSMFGGRECEVTLTFENRLAGVAADKFGSDIFVRKVNENHFEITVKVEISGQFYGWLFGLGNGVKISAPKAEAERFKEYINSVSENYK